MVMVSCLNRISLISLHNMSNLILGLFDDCFLYWIKKGLTDSCRMFSLIMLTLSSGKSLNVIKM